VAVHLERRFAFDDVVDAHRLLDGDHRTGKVVPVLT
jgi:hypothetical protein